MIKDHLRIALCLIAIPFVFLLGAIGDCFRWILCMLIRLFGPIYVRISLWLHLDDF